MAGLVSCPVSHPLVKSALEGAKRKLAPPVRPEEPLSVGIVQAIVNFYSLDVSLAFPHFLFILLEGFYGFFTVAQKGQSQISLPKHQTISQNTKQFPKTQINFPKHKLVSQNTNRFSIIDEIYSFRLRNIIV